MLIALLAQIQTAPVTTEGAIDFTWLFVKMLLALGIVSVLAVLILKYLVPHLSAVRHYQQNKYFRIIARCPLEHKKSLMLVSVGGRYFVLGVADSGINLIAEIDEQDAEKHE